MGEPGEWAGDGGVGFSVAASAASAVCGFGRSDSDRGRGGRLPAVFARPGRPSFTRPAHLGSRHGALAGDRGWLRHRGRDRLVRAFCPRNARRHRGRGNRHPRRAERAPLAHRSRSLLAGPCPSGGNGAAAPAKGARASSSSSSIFLLFAAGPIRRNSSNGFLASPTGIAPRCAGLSDADIRSRLAAMSEDELPAC